MNKHFVILAPYDRCIAPMEDSDEEMAFFSTVEEAREAAEGNPLAKAFGYEIFTIGEGLV